jgi:hypothetical protein
MKKENNTVYVKTFNKLGKLALTSILILMLSYAYGWSYIVPFIFCLIAMIIITSSSLAFGFVFFKDNEDIDNGVIYSKKQKTIITILSLIPALVFIAILNSSHYGNIERDQICDSKEYEYKDVCSQVLKDLYVVFKYSDSQVAEAVKEVKASANDMITTKSKELQLELENRKAFAEARERRDAKKQKEEQERKTLNININLNINIPGIDVIEQKIPLKIDPNSSEDIDVNVTKPVIEKSIRELMNEQVINHDNDRTNEDFHFEAIQNQIKNDLELRKEYILKRELLQHELEDIRRKNESLEDIKKNVMPYLFQEPKDNRFGDK